MDVCKARETKGLQMRAALFRALVALTLLGIGCMEPSDDLLDHCDHVTQVQVFDSRGQVLWQIETRDIRRICTIRYGAVPARFTQVVPVAGVPRPFRTNERIFVQRAMTNGWVRSDCNAVSARSLECAGYNGGPLNSPDRTFHGL